MDDTTARRFPLVARPRPACTPLPQRVLDLRQRAAALASHQNPDDAAAAATAVFNLAALLASDCGLPDLARHWCHRLAHTTLRPDLPTARQAMHALEPLINLARLHTRAGDGAAAWRILEDLHHAAQTRTDTVIDGIQVPASRLTTGPQAHHEICTRLWAVLLADGARALTVAGRWNDAHHRLSQYRGIGHRMLDGRQIAVIAHATAGDHSGALALLRDTQPGQPWEDAVTACLTLLCQPHKPTSLELNKLVVSFHSLGNPDGLAVFRTRLGLCLIEALGARHAGAQSLAIDLIDRATRDGYASRDLLTHRSFRDLASRQQTRSLTRVVSECGLDAGSIAPRMLSDIATALDTAEAVLTGAADSTCITAVVME